MFGFAHEIPGCEQQQLSNARKRHVSLCFIVTYKLNGMAQALLSVEAEVGV
jgi:hypothetical protein